MAQARKTVTPRLPVKPEPEIEEEFIEETEGEEEEEILLTADDPMYVTVDEENGRINLNLPIQPNISASGKSVVISTTNGNQQVDAYYEGNQLVAGINIYYPRKR
jgi:hypothetical protein